MTTAAAAAFVDVDEDKEDGGGDDDDELGWLVGWDDTVSIPVNKLGKKKACSVIFRVLNQLLLKKSPFCFEFCRV